MDTALWTLQLALAGIFVITGTTKLTQPRLKMAAGPMGWAADVTDEQFRAIGAVEVLGAIGLVLPSAFGVAPVLTPLAGVGLALAMAGAALTHFRLGEYSRMAPPLLLLVLALFVAVERLGPYSL